MKGATSGFVILGVTLSFSAGCAATRTASTNSRPLLTVPPVREWRSGDGEPRIAQQGARLTFVSTEISTHVERVSASSQQIRPFGTVMMLAIERDRRDWRREAYRHGRTSLEWCGLAEAGKPWVVFDPPVPLVKLPARAGSSKFWRGIVRTGNQRLDGAANSRIEDPERFELPNGRVVEAWPVRTTVTITDKDIDPISIQEVRWIVPGIGLFRRSRLEDGQMVHLQFGNSETTVTGR